MRASCFVIRLVLLVALSDNRTSAFVPRSSCATARAFTTPTPGTKALSFAFDPRLRIPQRVVHTATVVSMTAPAQRIAHRVVDTAAAITKRLADATVAIAVPTLAAILVFSVAWFGLKRVFNKEFGGLLKDLNEFIELFDEKQSSSKSGLYSDLYDSTQQPQQEKSRWDRFSSTKQSAGPAKNVGIPAKKYITITNINDRYSSYEYSMNVATESKAKAAAIGQRTNLERAFTKATSLDYTEKEMSSLNDAQTTFQTKGLKLLSHIRELQLELTRDTLTEKSGSTKNSDKDKKSRWHKFWIALTEDKDSTTETKETRTAKLADAQQELLLAEMEFVSRVISIAGPSTKRGESLKAVLLGDISSRGTEALLESLEGGPLTTLFQRNMTRPKSLFVSRFKGDEYASQVWRLREEVTAILRSAKPGDEALLVLETGGGTVTGYGSAAGQLKRLKDHNITLTVCVEKIAASGGYMMCCVADKIVASPFAMLGSIGVVSEQPNYYERLKDEGIEYQTLTAGKYKRTLTPTKKIIQADVEKEKQELEEILALFKEFVNQNRPSLDIDNIATGEVWFGTAAVDKGLCDEIRTLDDVLIEYVGNEYQVFDVRYTPPYRKETLVDTVFGPPEDDESVSLVGQTARWMVRRAAAQFGFTSGSQQRYMLKDDSRDRYRIM